MARVQLITTGDMEERALGKSLRRLFPDHEFVSLPRLDGFTSAPLPPTPPLPAGVRLNLDKFVAKLIGAFATGHRRDVTREPAHTSFARSLLADLVDMLGSPSEEITSTIVAGQTHPLTWPPPRDPVLRNV